MNAEGKIKHSVKKFLSKSAGVKIVLILFFLFFVLETVIQITPFLWVINNSIKTTEEIYESSAALTTTWSFGNYINVFSLFRVNGNYGYGTMLWNSVWQTALYLFINILSSMLLSYAISKFKFPGRGFLYGLMIFTQTIPIIGTGAAAYKLRYALGMVNNPWLIWISWAMGFDYSAFILYGTFTGISRSYSESAEIDGANEFQILFRVIFPQVLPCIVALLVTNFVGRWNDYGTAQVYLNDYPNLAYGLFLFQRDASYISDSRGVYFAALVISSVPGILLYACFQNLIIKNMSVGGIKG